MSILNALHWIAGLVLILLTSYCLSYRNNSLAKSLATFLFLSGAWAVLAACINLPLDLETRILLNRVKMFCAALLPLSIFYIGTHLNSTEKTSLWAWTGFSIVPVFMAILALTPFHELLVTNYSIKNFFGEDLLTFSNGSLFHLHSLAARILILWTLIQIYRGIKSRHQHHRLKSTLIIFAILIPSVTDSIAVYFVDYLRYIQILPAILPITGLIFTYIIFAERTLDIVPFARSQIINHMPDPCLMWNSYDLLVDFNPAAGHIMKLKEDSIGKPMSIILEKYPQIKTGSEFSTSEGKHFEVIWKDLIHHHKDQGKFLILRDITDQKRVEKELRQLDQVKTTFMGILSHDLMGNINNISFLSEIILKNHRDKLPEELKAQLESIHHSSVDVNNFISELLRWARTQFHGIQLNKKSELPSTIIRKAVDYLTPLAIDKEIEFELQLETEEAIEMDQNMIETVVRNILANAVKFSPTRSSINIKTQILENHLYVHIKDSGLDLNEVEVNKFISDGDDAHLGLGLLLSREFISLHQGKFWAQKSAQGHTIFSFMLPRLQS